MSIFRFQCFWLSRIEKRCSRWLRLHSEISDLHFYSCSLPALRTISIADSRCPTNPLYHLLPETDNPNNIVNLIFLKLKKNVTQITLLQNDAKGLISYLGADEISRILLRCQSDSTTAVTFFSWIKNDLGVIPTINNYCLIVLILVWSKKFKQAMQFLTELILLVDGCSSNDDIVFESLVSSNENCNWDPIVFDILLKCYVKMGFMKEGTRALINVLKFGYTPSVIVCNFLLNGLSKMKLVDWCWHVYEVMWKVGLRPNLCTFNILTRVLCIEGNVNKVNEFLDKMEAEGFVPDIVTYNTLICGYCQKGRLSDAFYLYKIMYRRGVIPDVISHTTLMKGLCKQNKARDARQLFHKMVDRGFNPDIITCNTLIRGYCKVGMIQEARYLLQEMLGNGIFPDNYTFHVLIKGHIKEGRLLSALNLVAGFEKYGISISWDNYDYLVASLCDDNRPFSAKTLIERISLYGHVPSREIYVKLTESFCRNDYVDHALLVIEEMVKKNIKCHLDVYKAIILCLCRNRTVEAESLMNEMIQSGIFPDREICSALVRGYCNEMNVGKAELLLEYFASKFQIFDSDGCNMLVRVLCRNNEVGKSIELQNKMLKVGFAPTSVTCKLVIHGLANTLPK